MKFTTLSNAEIYLKLAEISSKKNIELRFSDKQFYVLLLHLCEEIGEYDESKKMYFVQLSISAFMKNFSISSHTVQRALKLLSKCEIIERVPIKQFRKLSSKEVKVNKPYKTYINYSFL